MAEDEADPELEALVLRMTRTRRRKRPRLSEALYDAQDVRVETPFGAVQAWRLGEGPAVLMAHGWEDDNALWGPLIQEFAQIGRAVVALDLPGHGFSEAEEATHASTCAGVRAVADALGPIDAMIAHSYGCSTIMGVMEQGLEVKRAVLIAAPIPLVHGRAAKWLEIVGADQATLDRAAALFKARTGRDLITYDMQRGAATMRAEALILHALDDDMCPPENSRMIADAWPGAELMITDGLGHRLIVQDRDVMARIVDFIER